MSFVALSGATMVLAVSSKDITDLGFSDGPGAQGSRGSVGFAMREDDCVDKASVIMTKGRVRLRYAAVALPPTEHYWLVVRNTAGGRRRR